MSQLTNSKLDQLVNASGFLFQLAIEHRIRESTEGHRWHVRAHEYPWRVGDHEGFIDLVLAKGAGLLVVECKRARDGVWVFLVPNNRAQPVSSARCLWVAGREQDGATAAEWGEIHCAPGSHEAEFCVVRGGGEGDRALLERLASTLLTSIQALAEEELEILRRKHKGYYGLYLPVIVTNADLQVCCFQPSAVDLGTGDLTNSQFTSVPYIRFRKTLSNEAPANAKPDDLTEAAALRERSVFVVNARNLEQFLSELKIGGALPWDPFLRAKRS